ncbi:MAG: vitamin K epoxide reductase family protein [Candidatus Heimdallarchaeaceae archaeon]
MEKQKTVRRLLASSMVVSLLGFFDAIYLLYSDLVGVIFCPLEGGMLQCGKVQEWISSKPLVLHPSLWGTLFFLAVIVLLFLSVSQNNPYWLGFFLPLAGLVGLAFSIFLTIIEIFVITYFCEFCLFSALCTLALFIMIITAKKMEQGSIFANLDFWNMFKKAE